MSARCRRFPWWETLSIQERYAFACDAHASLRQEDRDGWGYAIDSECRIVGIWKHGLFEAADKYLVDTDGSYKWRWTP